MRDEKKLKLFVFIFISGLFLLSFFILVLKHTDTQTGRVNTSQHMAVNCCLIILLCSQKIRIDTFTEVALCSSCLGTCFCRLQAADYSIIFCLNMCCAFEVHNTFYAQQFHNFFLSRFYFFYSFNENISFDNNWLWWRWTWTCGILQLLLCYATFFFFLKITHAWDWMSWLLWRWAIIFKILVRLSRSS
jgi:hypothetical protein